MSYSMEILLSNHSVLYYVNYDVYYTIYAYDKNWTDIPKLIEIAKCNDVELIKLKLEIHKLKKNDSKK